MDQQQFRQLHNDLDYIAMQLTIITKTLTALTDPLRTLATVQARHSRDTQ